MTPARVSQSHELLHTHATRGEAVCMRAVATGALGTATVALPRVALPWVMAVVGRDLADQAVGGWRLAAGAPEAVVRRCVPWHTPTTRTIPFAAFPLFP